jgi:alkanesulfonate monooxygenase SsuD/methylene tetrahydromethanopterin reductase-like flavin-dependent oxidoreductase (luciferase family)
MKHNYWEVVQAMPAAELASLLKRFEDLGLYGIWSPQLFSPPFPTLAAAAMASTKLQLGSGIALAFTRSPLETALSALDIDRLSGGRMVLGLGTSVGRFNEEFHGVTYGKPVAHLREATEAIRAVIEQGHTGKLQLIDGEYCKLDLRGFNVGRKPVRDSIPIWISALFSGAVDSALKIADGLLGHPMWSLATISENAGRIDRALASSGRARANFHLNLWSYAAVANDRKTAIDDMRGTVAFYAGIKQYEKHYQAHGFGDAARAISEASARRDTAAMLKAVPDEMVTTFAIAGTPDETRERVNKMWEYADSITLTPPHNFIPADRIAHYHEAITNTFYSS